MKQLFLVFLLALGLPCASAFAQAAPPPPDLSHLVAPGSRVRLAVPAASPDPLVGRVVSISADSLMLERGHGARLQIDSREVSRIQVSTGHKRLRWALIGAGTGMLVGATLGAAAMGHDDTTGLAAAAGFVAGGIMGLPLGAGVGALAAPESWVPVALPGAGR